jgi:hypothetical protein
MVQRPQPKCLIFDLETVPQADDDRQRIIQICALRLSPLAFPQNPCHRLIKDYKMIRDSPNSPLSDCHSTLTLLADQQLAFDTLLLFNFRKGDRRTADGVSARRRNLPLTPSSAAIGHTPSARRASSDATALRCTPHAPRPRRPRRCPVRHRAVAAHANGCS